MTESRIILVAAAVAGLSAWTAEPACGQVAGPVREAAASPVPASDLDVVPAGAPLPIAPSVQKAIPAPQSAGGWPASPYGYGEGAAPGMPGVPPGAAPYGVGPEGYAPTLSGIAGPTAPTPEAAAAFGAAPGAAAPGFAAGVGSALSPATAGGSPIMLGDQSPFFVRQRIGTPTLAQTPPGIPQPPPIPPPFPPGDSPNVPLPEQRSLLTPGVRGFKIAENQSPIPLDRFFFSFNYFNNANEAVNEFFASPLANIRIYRYTFGFEKTFDQGRGSFGLRLPLNSVEAGRRYRFAAGGDSTALGDLTIFGKYILKQNPRTGSLVSAGLAITPPTGPASFAGADFLQTTPPIHNTTIQPFLGTYLNLGRWYLHGFTALDAPTNIRDVTMLYNDYGVGYFLYQNDAPDALLTAVVPTFEVHVNTPLTHRDPFDFNDPAGTANVVNLTYGFSAEFARNALLTFGWVTPVTSPKPFDYEVIALLNFRYGYSARAALRPTVPIIGG